MTTWAFGYFSTEERAGFVELLRAASERGSIIWLSAENAGVVDAFDTRRTGAARSDVLGAVLFDRGDVSTHRLAHVHPHGNWLDWRSAS